MKITKKSTLTAAVLAACFMAQVHAGGVHSLILGYGVLPNDIDYEIEYPNGTKSEGDSESDSAEKVSLMYQYLSSTEKKVAFVIGAGVEWNNIDYDNGPSDKQVGLRVEPGVAFNINRNFRIETVGSFAIGSSDINDVDSEDGAYAEIGVLARPVYVFDSGIRIAGHVGLVSHATAYEFDNGVESTGTRVGATAGISVGYQFGR